MTNQSLRSHGGPEATERMNSPLTGSWQSVRSNLPGYVPGKEWLHFRADGEDWWEIAQPSGKGKPSRNQVTLKAADGGYRMLLIRNGTETGFPVVIDLVSPHEIRVVPEHGFVTFFGKITGSSSASGFTSGLALGAGPP